MQQSTMIKSGVGNQINITNCALLLAGGKINWFYPKFYFYQLLS